MAFDSLRHRIYAGVLGKIIGVYLGRPIEGWAYQDIRNRFGEVNTFVHQALNLPLIVADDDISGTFGFFRAMEDYGYPSNLTARQIGETWLNYIIEDKTILWWGGLGRSTEHTAFLNLKRGIPAPVSGSIQQNSKAVAEQIGAQIFIEAFAMCHPGEPDKAVHLVRQAASVSHDGMAVDAACHLAALDAMAFGESNVDRLLDDAYPYLRTDSLKKLVNSVRNLCAKNSDWRQTRDDLERLYGYHLYPGTCHIAPNHALVLASILHGGNDFRKSIMISASSGWDTDCNAGNVGAFNGIRLGLDAINEKADLRSEVADRMYVITSDGGESVTDAVIQTDKIYKAYCRLHGEHVTTPVNRFSFSLPGALQGFTSCPYAPNQAHISCSEKPGITISCNLSPDAPVAISTPTFPEFSANSSSYLSTASPSLYETQEITCSLFAEQAGDIQTQIYVIYRDENGDHTSLSAPFRISTGTQKLKWRIPDLQGGIILRAGIRLSSGSSYTGQVSLLSMDWSNAPKHFAQSGVLMTDIWDLSPVKLQGWTSSARHFAADMVHTFCVSHPEENGLATIGTADWKNYSVISTLSFGFHRCAGLVARAKGHRQYYAAIFSDGKASIIRMQYGVRTVLADVPFCATPNTPCKVSFTVNGSSLSLSIHDTILVEATDDTYTSGGCGFLVDSGTFLADGIAVCEL